MASNGNGSRIRTLVVEDSAPVRRAICLFLEGQNDVEIVGTATDGREALEQIRALEPDLVLTDWQMPDMDGLELSALVRRFYPGMHIILITAFDSADVRTASLECGADAFVLADRLFEELPRELRRVFPRMDGR